VVKSQTINGDLVTLELQINQEEITGKLETSNGLFPFTATPADANPNAMWVGPYTAFLTTGSESQDLKGIGWARFRIHASGAVTISGQLGDGVEVSAGLVLTKGNLIPLYIRSVWNKVARGFISGRVHLRQTAESTVADGSLGWIHRAWSNGPFTFQSEVNFAAARYKAPLHDPFPLRIDSGLNRVTLELTGGELVAPIVASGFLRNDEFIPALSRDDLRANFNRVSGLVTGSFIHPVWNKEVFYRGVVQQAQNRAAGIFVLHGNALPVSGGMVIHAE
jgi:hypothetical protein